ncbi:MAG TPA: DUF2845 domain-containing protein [Steroidobacteraceae bacterium]|jgi:hypothetical protein|nr:DUF2845 domain-containing protein [Steroidobacteraceae bacterium]
MNARILATVAASLLPLVASAETFRCGKWIISIELTPGEIISKCGPPTSQDSRTEDVKARNPNTGLIFKTGETTTETWTWDRGPQAAPMVVTIVDGKVKSIERLRK